MFDGKGQGNSRRRGNGTEVNLRAAPTQEGSSRFWGFQKSLSTKWLKHRVTDPLTSKGLDEKENKRKERKSKRDEKLKRIMADDMHWSKFQNSLRRECANVHVNANALLLGRGANEALLDEIVERRFNEMQTLEHAIKEANDYKHRQAEADEGGKSADGKSGEPSFMKKTLKKTVERIFVHSHHDSDDTNLFAPKKVSSESSRTDDEERVAGVRDMRFGIRCSQRVYGWDDSLLSRSSHRGSMIKPSVSFRDDSILGLNSSASLRFSIVGGSNSIVDQRAINQRVLSTTGRRVVPVAVKDQAVLYEAGTNLTGEDDRV